MNDNAKLLVSVCFLAFCLMTLNGCTTQKVEDMWADEELDHYGAPSRYGEVRVFQKNDLQDLLITYEEEYNGKAVHRAYFVFKDGDRVDSYGKPAFVSPSVIKDLQQIPSDYGEFTDTKMLTNQPLWARVSSDNTCVMILTNGISAGSYEIPSYREKNVRKKLLLTPGTIFLEGVQEGLKEKLTGRSSD